MESTDEVYQILRDAKVLARRYYHLTNKPLHQGTMSSMA